MNLLSKTINKLSINLKQFNFINKFYLLINLFYYFVIRNYWIYILWNKWTEKLLYNKLFLWVKNIDNIKFNYFFEVFSFIDLFEEKKFQDKLMDSDITTFINIWANIWRNWYLIWRYNKNLSKTILVEPSPDIFNLLENFWKEYKIFLKSDLLTLKYWISNESKISKFYFPNNSLSWVWSIYKDFVKNNDVKEINIELITFEELFNKCNLWEDKNIWLLIDVEWHEYSVLESILNYLLKSKNKVCLKIVVEIWESKLSDMESLFKKYDSLKITNLEKLTDVDYYLEIKN